MYICSVKEMKSRKTTTDKYEQNEPLQKEKEKCRQRIGYVQLFRKIRTSKNMEIVHRWRMRLGGAVGLTDLRFLWITGFSSEASAYELTSDSGEDVADQNS